MTRVAQFLFLGLILINLIGCHSFMDKIPDSTTDVGAEQLTSFSAIQSQIIVPKCLSCHSASSPKGDVDLSSYSSMMATPGLIVPGNYAESSFYSEVESGDMPEDGPLLSTREVAAIAEWIESGAPNGDFSASNPTPTPTPAPAPIPSATPTPPPVTMYQQIQTKIFDKSCVRCHGGAKPSARVDLSSYEKLMGSKKSGLIQPGDAFRSTVYTEIEKGSMPPRGARVDSQLLLVLKNWINAGAKKN